MIRERAHKSKRPNRHRERTRKRENFRLSGRPIGFAGFLHCENQPDAFLGGMGNGDVIMLALGAFLGQISGEGRAPVKGEFCGVEDGVSEIAGASLFHVRVSAGQSAGLVDGWRQARVSGAGGKRHVGIGLIARMRVLNPRRPVLLCDSS